MTSLFRLISIQTILLLMDLKFFKALEIVIKSYSKQHAQKLIDHNLSIKIMLKVSLPSFL